LQGCTTNLLLLYCFGIAIDAREEDWSGGAIIDDEQERMIALELGGFHGPGRPVCEEDCGRRCCAALLVHLDLGHVLGVTDGDRLGGQIVKGGDGLVKHFAESHFGKDLMKRSESVRLKLN